MKKLILVLTGLLIAGGSSDAVVSFAQNADPASGSTTAAVARQAKKVVATGTIEPEEVIDVGAQVTGQIVKLGDDPRSPTKLIDYGSMVEAGTVLAVLDSRSYQAAVEREKAGYARAEAELSLAKISLKRVEAQLKRVQQAQKGGVSAYDVDQATFDVDAAKAAVAAAQAVVVQSKIALHEAMSALDNTIIKSPVKGVVIDRRVSVGQTVSPSLNTPSLFLVASDLNKLQIWASVHEANITRIHPGQPVRFTVDAFPGKVFEGKVVQVRLNAQMVQNNVTYTVVVAITGSKEKLLPYLTANVEFE